MKIGVLGGTFDPVHVAHIAMAEKAREALELDEVLLVPAGQPMYKVNRAITPAMHRVAMLQLAVKGKPGLAVSAMELDRPGPSYTVDSIAQLRKYEPGSEIYFILGSDSLAQLPDWREPARLVAMCRLVALARTGYPRPDMKKLEGKVPGINKKVIFLDWQDIDVSATDIREKVSQGKSVDGLVPRPVAEYIKKHKLYLNAGGN
jgi:nicotinate-nucleotide adenylyltransferase